jgi:hypothetical protein
LLSGTRRKPAHCSNAFGPSFGTFSSSCLAVNAPFSSRYFTMFFAVAAFSPATCRSSEGEAVLTSTPTALTQSSTTPLRASRLSRFCGMSC